MKSIRTQTVYRAHARALRTVLTIAFIGLSFTLPSLASASPIQRAVPPGNRFDTPSWLSESSAASLNVGVDVLVPSDPPAPFSGEPAISASGGYYNLYWLIGGSPPTFLSITGESGGSIPAYSKYDRNVELTVNASVNGSDAYHDVTPIYDLVYWQVGGVVYSVESHNMTGSDSLSLAESLVTLTPAVAVDPTPSDTPTPVVDSNSSGTGGNESVPPTPTATDAAGNASSGVDPTSTDVPTPDAPSTDTPTVTPSLDGNSSAQAASSGAAALTVPVVIDAGGTDLVTVSGSKGYTLKAEAGIFTATGRDSIVDVADADLQWEAPSPDADQTVTFQLVNGNDGKVMASTQTIVSTDPTKTLVCPASATAAKDVAFVVRGSGLLSVKTDIGTFPANGVNADFSSNGGKSSISGTIPAAGQVQLDWKAPTQKTDAVANLTVTNENGDAIGTCAIKVAKTAAKASATPRPAVNAAAQKSDGTDLTVTGPGQVKAHSGVRSVAAAGGAVDDGSGILAPVTPQPGSTPTPAPTKAPPTATKKSTPSVKPTATLAPTLDTSGMVSQVIGPDGGQLSCPTGATITFPAGALEQLATVTLRPVAGSKLPAGASVDLLPGTAFDITVAAMDGKSIDGLVKPAKFSIALASDKWRSGTTLYAVDGVGLAQLSDVTLHGDSVSAPVNRLSRYVAGVPVIAPPSAKRSVAKLVMAGAALVFFVSVAALAFKLWLGRKTTMTVGPRRLR